jgi:hypothetical protein
LKRFYHLLFLLFFLPVFAGAQTDTVVVLADSFPAPPPPAYVEEDNEEEYAEAVEDDHTIGAFLPRYSWSIDSYKLRSIDPAVIKAQQADEDFWYANYSFKKPEPVKEKEYRRALVDHPAFEVIMWIVVIAGFITFLVIFLTNNNVKLFRSSTLIKETPSEVDFDDIFSINYQLEVGKAVAAGDLNLAIRLHFLRLLSKLAERNIIEYKQDRTNMDYLMQLYKNRYYQEFFRLTRHYEFAWYGQFPVDREKYELIRNEFETFERNLN